MLDSIYHMTIKLILERHQDFVILINVIMDVFT